MRNWRCLFAAHLMNLALLCLGRAEAGSIGLFFDPEGTQCSVQQAPQTGGVIYVIAIESVDPSEIGVACFRITGFPADWFGGPPILAHLGVSHGNPFTAEGTLIQFGACPTFTNGRLLLCSLNYFATSPATNLYLSVAQAGPIYSDIPCPWLRTCPNGAQFCQQGGQAIINPAGGGCTVAVQERPWSQIKDLYKQN